MTPVSTSLLLFLPSIFSPTLFCCIAVHLTSTLVTPQPYFSFLIYAIPCAQSLSQLQDCSQRLNSLQFLAHHWRRSRIDRCLFPCDLMLLARFLVLRDRFFWIGVMLDGLIPDCIIA